jgi:hypothetical protein
VAIASGDRDGGQGEALGRPRRECGVYAEPESSVNRAAGSVVAQFGERCRTRELNPDGVLLPEGRYPGRRVNG